MLDRDAILSKRNDFPTETVHVPALGGDVAVGVLTTAELVGFYAAQDKLTDKGGTFAARLAVATVRDAAGGAMFTAEDVDALNQLPWSALHPIVDVAMAINGMTEKATPDAKKD